MSNLNFSIYRYRVVFTDRHGELAVEYVTKYVYDNQKPEDHIKALKELYIKKEASDIEISYQEATNHNIWELI